MQIRNLSNSSKPLPENCAQGEVEASSSSRLDKNFNASIKVFHFF